MTKRLFSRVADWLFGATPFERDFALLLLRLWFGLVLALGHGLSKVTNLGAFIADVGGQGVPFPAVSGTLAALSELVGGLLLAAGLFTRVAALSIVATLAVAALVFHAGEPFREKEFALAYAVAALVLAIGGAGRFSVDARLNDKRRG
jgi:putative oxidoreductase